MPREDEPCGINYLPYTSRESRRSMNIVARIANILLNIWLVVLIIAAVILLAGFPFSVKPYVVLSGSMEPEYPVGSLVYVDESVPFSDIQQNDVISFQLTDDTICTHRAVEVDQEASSITTKGDANENIDGGSVTPDTYIGRAVFMLPLAGFAAAFAFNNTIGTIVFAIVIAIILYIISNLSSGDSGETQSERTKDRTGSI